MKNVAVNLHNFLLFLHLKLPSLKFPERGTVPLFYLLKPKEKGQSLKRDRVAGLHLHSHPKPNHHPFTPPRHPSSPHWATHVHRHHSMHLPRPHHNPIHTTGNFTKKWNYLLFERSKSLPWFEILHKVFIKSNIQIQKQ